MEHKGKPLALLMRCQTRRNEGNEWSKDLVNRETQGADDPFRGTLTVKFPVGKISKYLKHQKDDALGNFSLP